MSTAAARWRFTFLASISLFPPSGAHWSRSFDTNLDSHIHSDAAPVRTLLWRVLHKLLFNSCGGFWNISDFTKQDHGRISDRCGECSGTVSVRLRGAQRCCWTSRQRSTVPISLSPLNPNKLSNTAKWFSFGLRPFFPSQVRSVNSFFVDY